MLCWVFMPNCHPTEIRFKPSDNIQYLRYNEHIYNCNNNTTGNNVNDATDLISSNSQNLS